MDFNELARQLDLRRRAYGFTWKELMVRTGCSDYTLRTGFKSPENFRLETLMILCEMFHIGIKTRYDNL